MARAPAVAAAAAGSGAERGRPRAADGRGGDRAGGGDRRRRVRLADGQRWQRHAGLHGHGRRHSRAPERHAAGDGDQRFARARPGTAQPELRAAGCGSDHRGARLGAWPLERAAGQCAHAAAIRGRRPREPVWTHRSTRGLQRIRGVYRCGRHAESEGSGGRCRAGGQRRLWRRHPRFRPWRTGSAHSGGAGHRRRRGGRSGQRCVVLAAQGSCVESIHGRKRYATSHLQRRRAPQHGRRRNIRRRQAAARGGSGDPRMAPDLRRAAGRARRQREGVRPAAIVARRHVSRRRHRPRVRRPSRLSQPSPRCQGGRRRGGGLLDLLGGLL